MDEEDGSLGRLNLIDELIGSIGGIRAAADTMEPFISMLARRRRPSLRDNCANSVCRPAKTRQSLVALGIEMIAYHITTG